MVLEGTYTECSKDRTSRTDERGAGESALYPTISPPPFFPAQAYPSASREHACSCEREDELGDEAATDLSILQKLVANYKGVDSKTKT